MSVRKGTALVLPRTTHAFCAHSLTPTLRADGLVLFTTDYFNLIGSDDALVNSLITSGAELPSVILVALLLASVGRRNMQTIALVTCGVCLFALLAPDLPNALAVGLSFVARGAILAAYAVAYVYTPELYTTDVRTSGLGIAAALAKVASVATPFVAKLPPGSEHITLAVFATLCLITGAATLLLPQDRGRPPALADFAEVHDASNDKRHENTPLLA